jgi:hypothetical protein
MSRNGICMEPMKKDSTLHPRRFFFSFFFFFFALGGERGWIFKLLLFLCSHHVLIRFSKFPMCSPRVFSIAPHSDATLLFWMPCFFFGIFLQTHTRIFFLDACLAEQSWGEGTGLLSFVVDGAAGDTCSLALLSDTSPVSRSLARCWTIRWLV